MFLKWKNVAAVVGAIALIFGSLSATSAGDFTVKPGPGASAESVALVEDGLAKSASLYAQLFGIRVSRTQNVYVSSDPTFLGRAYVDEKQIGHWYDEAVKVWTNQREAEAAYGFFMLRSNASAFSGRGTAGLKRTLWPAVSHEVFHLLQYDLVGRKSRTCCRQDRVSVIGPAWLMEGSADYAAFQFGERYLDKQMRFELQRARVEALALKGSLAQLETGNSLYPLGQRGYAIGAYATHQLVERAGLQSVPDFYRRLARTSNWKQAFADAFGISVADFYARFPDG